MEHHLRLATAEVYKGREQQAARQVQKCSGLVCLGSIVDCREDRDRDLSHRRVAELAGAVLLELVPHVARAARRSGKNSGALAVL
eukprot:s217_g4.t1